MDDQSDNLCTCGEPECNRIIGHADACIDEQPICRRCGVEPCRCEVIDPADHIEPKGADPMKFEVDYFNKNEAVRTCIVEVREEAEIPKAVKKHDRRFVKVRKFKQIETNEGGTL